MTTTEATALWCDNFDADLLTVVPGVDDALGDIADMQLWTHCRPTDGRINSPAAWHTDLGLTAFFSTDRDRPPAPAHYLTNDPLVRCTFLEAVRDEWIHSSVIVVDGLVVWEPPVRQFERLMYDVRGWQILPDGEREAVRGDVVASLLDAAERVRRIVART